MAIAISALVLTAFYRYERARERRNLDPLFEFGQLEHPSFRYGLQTTMVLAMGQFGLLLVIPVLLQDGQHFTAVRTGVYMLPDGTAHRLGRADRRALHAAHRHRSRRARRVSCSKPSDSWSSRS